MDKLNCILLVDDNDATNVFNEYIINELGVCDTIRNVHNGLEALNYIKGEEDYCNRQKHPLPELIFLDINMPKMGGFEFIEEYQKLPEVQKTAIVIFLTTSCLKEDEIKAKSFPKVMGLETKPLSEEQLEQIMISYTKKWKLSA